MGPIFNEKVKICGSHKQYMGPTNSVIADKYVDVESGVGPVHCAYTVHVLKNIKNRSHGTIYIFKNYFVTVFSVFSFQFQQQ